MKKSTLFFLAVGIGLGTIGFKILEKKEALDRLIKKLDFAVRDIRNVKLSFKHIKLDLHIRALNPTTEQLSIYTGIIKASVLRVYDKSTGKMLGHSNLDLNEINIPAGGFLDLPKAHIKIPTLSGAEIVLNEIKGNKESILKRLRFEIDFTALGKTHTIKF